MNLKKNIATLLLLCTATLGLALSGCSSGASFDSATAPNQSKSTVFGVAALGTATPSGTVSAKDSSVPPQEKMAAIGSNGSFTMDVSGLNPPYLLKAVSTDSTGTTIQMYSISMMGGKTNINEITDVAVAAAANGANPANLYAMPTRDTYQRTSDDFGSIISRLQTVLAPLFALYNVSGSPVTDDDHEYSDYRDDDNGGLSALLHDVRFIVDDGRVVVKNRATGAIIFSGRLRDLESGTFYPANMPAGPGGSTGSTTCTSFTYSGWGTCQSNGTQTRTVATSSPAGCTGGTPVLSQSCIYVPPACTYNYSTWGACQSNGTQTRTAQSSPAGCTGTPILSQSCTYVPTCSSFTYSAWGACQSNNTQTRTVATSSPTGCTGGAPVLSQSCTYVPPVTACTSFTYSAWGACQSNNTQTRTVATSSPAGCIGGSPVVSQACTYTPPSTLTLAQVTTTCTACHGLTVNGVVLRTGGYTVSGRTASAWVSAITGMFTPPSGTTVQDFANFLAALTSAPPATCTSFTYSAWGACQSNNTQTRTVATSLPSGCTGGTPAALSQACTYVPPVTTCTSFTYSAWGACQSNNTQTRTIATSLPSGCTGGTPAALSQACTYVPPVTTCTSFTYSAWGACQSNNTQTRTVATSLPSGCTGGTPAALSQACTYVPPVTTCTSFTYSAWGVCQSNNTQTRTVATSSPAGCTGGSPVLSQSCVYVPPTPVCGSCHAIPPSTGHHTYHYPSRATCSTCHGAGYSPTAVTAATHMNGTVNTVASLNFNATTGSCSPSCHGTKTW